MAAGQLDTASEARFQGVLPLEPVNRPRLAALKAARTTARLVENSGGGRFEARCHARCHDRLRRAQIAARHALQAIGAGLAAHQMSAAVHGQVMAAAIHAAELQLPESWLPFVVSR